jgi:outer membrane protein
MRTVQFSQVMLGLSLILLSFESRAEPKPLGIMDAIHQAMKNHPRLMIGRQNVRANQGAVRAAWGKFDWTLQGNLGHAQTSDSQRYDMEIDRNSRIDATTMGVSVSKLLPWGMIVSTGADLSKTNTTIDDTLSMTSTVSSTPIIGTLSLTVTQPLLRGFGDATIANLDASKQEWKASRFEFQQTIVQQIRQVASNYWAYVSAQAFLDAATESEGRSLKLLNDNRRLVQADLRPAAELRQLEANYSDTKRSRLGAEQSLVEARYQLGVAIGLDAHAAMRLGRPQTAMPTPPPPEKMKLESESSFRVALVRRPDLKALKHRTKAAKLRVSSSQNASLPQLDLNGQVKYAGLGLDGETTSSAALGPSPLPGYTAFLNLNLSWPPQNNFAEGIHAQAVASHRIAQESERALTQQIGASVFSAADGLEKRARIAHEGIQAARLYAQSVQNEEKKLKAGLSTLINLVLIEERLANAKATEISGLQRYAEAILNFRFATGTLMKSDSASTEISPEKILRFPTEMK